MCWLKWLTTTATSARLPVGGTSNPVVMNNNQVEKAPKVTIDKTQVSQKSTNKKKTN